MFMHSIYESVFPAYAGEAMVKLMDEGTAGSTELVRRWAGSERGGDSGQQLVILWLYFVTGQEKKGRVI